nr:MAG TPA: hypothetical protein [Caudoviricetes sp.]
MRFICDLICDHFLRPIYRRIFVSCNLLINSDLRRYFWSQRI